MPSSKSHLPSAAVGALNSYSQDTHDDEIRHELHDLLSHAMLLSELTSRIQDNHPDVTPEYVQDVLIDMDDVITYTVPPRRSPDGRNDGSNSETVYKLATIEKQQEEDVRELVESVPQNTPYGELLQRISERFTRIKE